MTSQTLANHTRWHAPFHFFVVPVMVINFIWSFVQFVLTPGFESGRWVVVSVALVVLTFLVRTNPLRVQDRLIQLEERLRYQQLLAPTLLPDTSSLRRGQVIALRFAADDELEELVSAVLAGKITKPKEIKRAIRNWRGDTLIATRALGQGPRCQRAAVRMAVRNTQSLISTMRPDSSATARNSPGARKPPSGMRQRISASTSTTSSVSELING